MPLSTEAIACGKTLLAFNKAIRKKSKIMKKSNLQPSPHFCHPMLFHLGLVILVICYLVIGALIFNLIEGTNEEKLIKQRLDKKNISIEKIENLTSSLIDFMLEEKGTGEQNAASITREFYLVVAQINQIAEDGGIDLLSVGDLRKMKRQTISVIQDDETELKNWSFPSCLLYAFSVITTIGYGRLYLETVAGKVFCIIYAIIGIPLTVIVAAILGRHCLNWTMKFFCKYCCCRNDERNRTNPLKTSGFRYPLKVWLFPIFILYLILGAVMLPIWLPFNQFNGFYFSFSAITTIVYGDAVPTDYVMLIPTLIYIFIGLCILVTFIDVFSDLYKKIYFFGQPIANVRGTTIWFGGKEMTTEDLVNALGKMWHIPKDRSADLDLDALVHQTLAQPGQHIDDDMSEVVVTEQEPQLKAAPQHERDAEPESDPDPLTEEKVSEFSPSKFLGLEIPTEKEYEALRRPIEDLLPIPSYEPYFNPHHFYLVKTHDVRARYPAASTRCKDCKLAFLSPLLTTNGYKHIAIVHWERYIKWSTKARDYSEENDLKLVMVHPWYECLVGRYPYFVLDLLQIDRKLLKPNGDVNVLKLIQEQFGIEDFSSFQAVPTEEWAKSPV